MFVFAAITEAMERMLRHITDQIVLDLGQTTGAQEEITIHILEKAEREVGIEIKNGK